MKCRFCAKNIDKVFIDLGSTAVSNAFIGEEAVNQKECIYPLKVLVCDNCFLVQVDEFQKKEEIFSSDYVYFSSVSDNWLAHSKSMLKKLFPNSTSILNPWWLKSHLTMVIYSNISKKRTYLY